MMYKYPYKIMNNCKIICKIYYKFQIYSKRYGGTPDYLYTFSPNDNTFN